MSNATATKSTTKKNTVKKSGVKKSTVKVSNIKNPEVVGNGLEATVNATETNKKTRIRRNPVTLLEDLKAQRDKLTQSFESKLSKLNSRIERIERKNAKKIAVAELLATKTPEELEAELQAIKEQQRIIKAAAKQATV